jgi:hypothetical protein
MLFASASFAECEGQSERNERFVTMFPGSASHFTVAAELADAGCYALANEELKKSNDELAKESWDDEGIGVRKQSAEAMSEYVSALMASERSVEESNRRLLDLLDKTYVTDVMLRAIRRLSTTLPSIGSDGDWRRFESHLAELESHAPSSWIPIYARCLRDATHGRMFEAIARLDERMARESDLQTHLTYRVLLVQLLVLDHRYANVRVQCARDDDAIGASLLDPRLRLAFLDSCLSAWKTSADRTLGLQDKEAIQMLSRTIASLRSQI